MLAIGKIRTRGERARVGHDAVLITMHEAVCTTMHREHHASGCIHEVLCTHYAS